MQLNTQKCPLPTRGYEERALAEMERRAYEAEQKLAVIKDWAITEEFRNSGSDRLYQILGVK